jgi:hypothetical protein
MARGSRRGDIIGLAWRQVIADPDALPVAFGRGLKGTKPTVSFPWNLFFPFRTMTARLRGRETCPPISAATKAIELPRERMHAVIHGVSHDEFMAQHQAAHIQVPRHGARAGERLRFRGNAASGIAERTLYAVFRKSGVTDAHAHRYRHTPAARPPGEASLQTVADILGNTAEVVREHYGKWSKGRQDTIDRLMVAHFQSAQPTNPVTKKSHEISGAVN